MPIEICPDSPDSLADYARIPIAFQVDRILDVAISDNGLGGIRLFERALAQPYIKDYDEIKGEGPTRWARRWDLSNWGILSAHLAGQRVGGAAIAFNTPGVDMLEDRKELAALWDLRVAPDVRGQGIGHALFTAATAWAAQRRCHQLKVETQNINLPACKFYARQGCMLGTIQRFAYPELPDEVRLLWYKEL